MLKEKNNIQKIIESATEKTEAMIDVNKIVGTKIINEKGQTAIPVSKVTVGVFSGGGEYGDLKISKELGEHLAGGAITITSVKPECFLIDNGNGFMVTSTNSVIDNLLSSIMQVIQKVKN